MTAPTTAALSGQAGLAQSQRAQQDVQEQSRQIDALKRGLQPVKDKSKKLREACEGFESVFIQKMWEQMRATVPKGGMLQGRDEQYWQGMFDQELSKKMSSAGGIGLADMMYEQLSRNLVSASRTTASGLGAAQKAAADKGADTGFVVSAAPLLPLAPSSAPSSGPSSASVSGQNADKKGMYHAEAPQPEAEEEGAPSQNADAKAGLTAQQEPGAQASATVAASANPAARASGQGGQGAAGGTGAAPSTGTPPPNTSSPTSADTPPEVQQVLEQLRAQAGLGGMGTTMTGAQAIAAVQAMTPMQALALSQGKTWAEVQGMGSAPMQNVLPNMGTIPTGVDAARAAAQTANTRMPAGGVLPPMSPLQRQGQMHYSAAKTKDSTTAGEGASNISRSAANPAAHGNNASPAPVAANSTMPLNPHLSSNVQGNPGVRPSHFVQNSPLIPSVHSTAQAAPAPNAAPAASDAPLSMTAEQIAALSGQANQAGQAGQPNQANQALQGQGAFMPTAAMGQPYAAAGTQPAIPPTAQEPQIINTTFSTNIPPKRRNGRQGQRVPKGQATIRSLNAG